VLERAVPLMVNLMQLLTGSIIVSGVCPADVHPNLTSGQNLNGVTIELKLPFPDTQRLKSQIRIGHSLVETMAVRNISELNHCWDIISTPAL
jgi:hypothetical protein